MPVIPVIQQGQRLQPSSPVPLANTEGARGPGETIAGFGQALSNLGNVLEKSDRASRNQADQLAAEAAAIQLQRQLNQTYREQVGKAVNPEDKDSTGAANVFQEQAYGVVDSIKESLGNDTQKQIFANKAGQAILDMSTQVYATEVKKMAEHKEFLKNKLLADRGALAAEAPEELGFILQEAEASVLSDLDYTDAEKDKRIYEVKRSIVGQAIQGMRQNENWASAEITLKQYQSLFSEEEKGKKFDEIMNDKWTSDKRALDSMDRIAKDAANAKKVKEDATYSAAYDLLAQAGNDTVKRNLIISDLERSGALPPDRMNSLKGGTVEQMSKDDSFEAQMMEDITRNWDEAAIERNIKKVNSARGRQNGVSDNRAIDLLSKLQNMRTKIRDDGGTFQKVYTESKGIIEAQLAEDIMAPMNDLAKSAHRQKVAQVTSIYAKLATKPNANPTAIANSLVKQYFGVSTLLLKGKTNYLNLNSIDGVEKTKQKLIQDEILRNKAVKRSPKEKVKAKAELTRALKELDGRAMELVNQNPQSKDK